MRLIVFTAMIALAFAPATGFAKPCRDAQGHFAKCPPPAAVTPSGSGSDYYRNSAGNEVHRPVRTRSRPAGATAQCRDGSWSFSQSHRGTCSHHGGVASWL